MDNPTRILLIQLKRAGDVIVTTPVIGAIRATLPHCRIDFLVDKAFASILEGNPNIDEVHLYDRQKPWATARALRQKPYDWILDFQSSPRSVLVGILSGAKRRAGYRVPFWGLFFNSTVRRPGDDVSVTEGKMTLVRSLLPGVSEAAERKIWITEKEREWTTRIMGLKEPGRQALGLIPTHRRNSRRWTAESFSSVGRYFAEREVPVWLFWGPGEEAYVSAIQKEIPKSIMIPRTSLREMAALLERCRVVISNDNGPMHVAEAVATPTVTIYGPTHPGVWNMGGPDHQVMQASGLSCLGCDLNECPFGHECMTHVTAEQVIREADRLMARVPVES